MLASVVATLAGIIPNPVQAHLGIHRVRLIRQPGKIALIDGRCPLIPTALSFDSLGIPLSSLL